MQVGTTKVFANTAISNALDDGSIKAWAPDMVQEGLFDCVPLPVAILEMFFTSELCSLFLGDALNLWPGPCLVSSCYSPKLPINDGILQSSVMSPLPKSQAFPLVKFKECINDLSKNRLVLEAFP